MIYLDHNATTAVDVRVLDAMLPFFRDFFGNPSSLHRTGRLCRGAVETAREQVATLAGASPSQVVFTSGGTESNNLALQGGVANRSGKRIVIGATEHASVIEPAVALERSGRELVCLPVDDNGILYRESIENCIREETALVSAMLANNETGVLQDISALAEHCAYHEIPLHCDAVQAAGKIPLDFERCGADLLSISAHKIAGPKGVGALIMNKSIDLQGLLHGGGQERGLRAGTENVPAIVGFGKAAELALEGLDANRAHLVPIREHLENGLAKFPAVTVFAESSERLPNTVMFGTRGMDGEMLVMELDRQGFAVSSGSACASMGKDANHVLSAMGVDPALAKSAVRVSLGAENNVQDIDQFIGALSRFLPAGTLEANV